MSNTIDSRGAYMLLVGLIIVWVSSALLFGYGTIKGSIEMEHICEEYQFTHVSSSITTYEETGNVKYCKYTPNEDRTDFFEVCKIFNKAEEKV